MVDESLIENPLMSPPIPFLIEEWIDFSTDQSNFDCGIIKEENGKLFVFSPKTSVKHELNPSLNVQVFRTHSNRSRTSVSHIPHPIANFLSKSKKIERFHIAELELISPCLGRKPQRNDYLTSNTLQAYARSILEIIQIDADTLSSLSSPSHASVVSRRILSFLSGDLHCLLSTLMSNTTATSSTLWQSNRNSPVVLLDGTDLLREVNPFLHLVWRLLCWWLNLVPLLPPTVSLPTSQTHNQHNKTILVQYPPHWPPPSMRRKKGSSFPTYLAWEAPPNMCIRALWPDFGSVMSILCASESSTQALYEHYHSAILESVVATATQTLNSSALEIEQQRTEAKFGLKTMSEEEDNNGNNQDEGEAAVALRTEPSHSKAQDQVEEELPEGSLPSPAVALHLQSLLSIIDQVAFPTTFLSLPVPLPHGVNCVSRLRRIQSMTAAKTIEDLRVNVGCLSHGCADDPSLRVDHELSIDHVVVLNINFFTSQLDGIEALGRALIARFDSDKKDEIQNSSSSTYLESGWCLPLAAVPSLLAPLGFISARLAQSRLWRFTPYWNKSLPPIISNAVTKRLNVLDERDARTIANDPDWVRKCLFPNLDFLVAASLPKQNQKSSNSTLKDVNWPLHKFHSQASTFCGVRLLTMPLLTARLKGAKMIQEVLNVCFENGIRFEHSSPINNASSQQETNLESDQSDEKNQKNVDIEGEYDQKTHPAVSICRDIATFLAHENVPSLLLSLAAHPRVISQGSSSHRQEYSPSFALIQVLEFIKKWHGEEIVESWLIETSEKSLSVGGPQWEIIARVLAKIDRGVGYSNVFELVLLDRVRKTIEEGDIKAIKESCELVKDFILSCMSPASANIEDVCTPMVRNAAQLMWKAVEKGCELCSRGAFVSQDHSDDGNWCFDSFRAHCSLENDLRSPHVDGIKANKNSSSTYPNKQLSYKIDIVAPNTASIHPTFTTSSQHNAADSSHPPTDATIVTNTTKDINPYCYLSLLPSALHLLSIPIVAQTELLPILSSLGRRVTSLPSPGVSAHPLLDVLCRLIASAVSSFAFEVLCLNRHSTLTPTPQQVADTLLPNNSDPSSFLFALLPVLSSLPPPFVPLFFDAFLLLPSLLSSFSLSPSLISSVLQLAEKTNHPTTLALAHHWLSSLCSAYFSSLVSVSAFPSALLPRTPASPSSLLVAFSASQQPSSPPKSLSSFSIKPTPLLGVFRALSFINLFKLANIHKVNPQIPSEILLILPLPAPHGSSRVCGNPLAFSVPDTLLLSILNIRNTDDLEPVTANKTIEFAAIRANKCSLHSVASRLLPSLLPIKFSIQTFAAVSPRFALRSWPPLGLGAFWQRLADAPLPEEFDVLASFLLALHAGPYSIDKASHNTPSACELLQSFASRLHLDPSPPANPHWANRSLQLLQIILATRPSALRTGSAWPFSADFSVDASLGSLARCPKGLEREIPVFPSLDINFHAQQHIANSMATIYGRETVNSLRERQEKQQFTFKLSLLSPFVLNPVNSDELPPPPANPQSAVTVTLTGFERLGRLREVAAQTWHLPVLSIGLAFNREPQAHALEGSSDNLPACFVANGLPRELFVFRTIANSLRQREVQESLALARTGAGWHDPSRSVLAIMQAHINNPPDAAPHATIDPAGWLAVQLPALIHQLASPPSVSPRRDTDEDGDAIRIACLLHHIPLSPCELYSASALINEPKSSLIPRSINSPPPILSPQSLTNLRNSQFPADADKVRRIYPDLSFYANALVTSWYRAMNSINIPHSANPFPLIRLLRAVSLLLGEQSSSSAPIDSVLRPSLWHAAFTSDGYPLPPSLLSRLSLLSTSATFVNPGATSPDAPASSGILSAFGSWWTKDKGSSSAANPPSTPSVSSLPNHGGASLADESVALTWTEDVGLPSPKLLARSLVETGIGDTLVYILEHILDSTVVASSISHATLACMIMQILVRLEWICGAFSTRADDLITSLLSIIKNCIIVTPLTVPPLSRQPSANSSCVSSPLNSSAAQTVNSGLYSVRKRLMTLAFQLSTAIAPHSVKPCFLLCELFRPLSSGASSAGAHDAIVEAESVAPPPILDENLLHVFFSGYLSTTISCVRTLQLWGSPLIDDLLPSLLVGPPHSALDSIFSLAATVISTSARFGPGGLILKRPMAVHILKSCTPLLRTIESTTQLIDAILHVFPPHATTDKEVLVLCNQLIFGILLPEPYTSKLNQPKATFSAWVNTPDVDVIPSPPVSIETLENTPSPAPSSKNENADEDAGSLCLPAPITTSTRIGCWGIILQIARADSHAANKLANRLLRALKLHSPSVRSFSPEIQILRAGLVSALGPEWFVADPASQMDEQSRLVRSVASNSQSLSLCYPIIPGIQNLGNTCYANSLLQVLRLHAGFRQALEDVNVKRTLANVRSLMDGSVSEVANIAIPIVRGQSALYQLRSLFRTLTKEEQANVRAAMGGANLIYPQSEGTPRALLRTLRDWEGNSLDPRVQMDAEEFLMLLLARLEEEAVGSQVAARRKSLDCGEAMLDPRTFFGGMVVTETASLECEHRSRRDEDFVVLSVPLKASLDECLSQFTSMETLEGDNKFACEGCSEKKVDATRRAKLMRLPNCMIVALKRFEFDLDSMRKVKRNDVCTFPLTLNLKPYADVAVPMSNFDANKTGIELKRRDVIMQQFTERPKPDSYYQYCLSAVIIHSGNSEFGHYIALARTNSTILQSSVHTLAASNDASNNTSSSLNQNKTSSQQQVNLNKNGFKSVADSREVFNESMLAAPNNFLSVNNPNTTANSNFYLKLDALTTNVTPPPSHPSHPANNSTFSFAGGSKAAKIDEALSYLIANPHYMSHVAALMSANNLALPEAVLLALNFPLPSPALSSANDSSGDWVVLNDTEVQTFNLDGLAKEAFGRSSQSAYLLFYDRVAVYPPQDGATIRTALKACELFWSGAGDRDEQDVESPLEMGLPTTQESVHDDANSMRADPFDVAESREVALGRSSQQVKADTTDACTTSYLPEVMSKEGATTQEETTVPGALAPAMSSLDEDPSAQVSLVSPFFEVTDSQGLGVFGCSSQSPPPTGVSMAMQHMSSPVEKASQPVPEAAPACAAKELHATSSLLHEDGTATCKTANEDAPLFPHLPLLVSSTTLEALTTLGMDALQTSCDLESNPHALSVFKVLTAGLLTIAPRLSGHSSSLTGLTRNLSLTLRLLLDKVWKSNPTPSLRSPSSNGEMVSLNEPIHPHCWVLQQLSTVDGSYLLAECLGPLSSSHAQEAVLSLLDHCMQFVFQKYPEEQTTLQLAGMASSSSPSLSILTSFFSSIVRACNILAGGGKKVVLTSLDIEESAGIWLIEPPVSANNRSTLCLRPHSQLLRLLHLFVAVSPSAAWFALVQGASVLCIGQLMAGVESPITDEETIEQLLSLHDYSFGAPAVEQEIMPVKKVTSQNGQVQPLHDLETLSLWLLPGDDQDVIPGASISNPISNAIANYYLYEANANAIQIMNCMISACMQRLNPADLMQPAPFPSVSSLVSPLPSTLFIDGEVQELLPTARHFISFTCRHGTSPSLVMAVAVDTFRLVTPAVSSIKSFRPLLPLQSFSPLFADESCAPPSNTFPSLDLVLSPVGCISPSSSLALRTSLAEAACAVSQFLRANLLFDVAFMETCGAVLTDSIRSDDEILQQVSLFILGALLFTTGDGLETRRMKFFLRTLGDAVASTSVLLRSTLVALEALGAWCLQGPSLILPILFPPSGNDLWNWLFPWLRNSIEFVRVARSRSREPQLANVRLYTPNDPHFQFARLWSRATALPMAPHLPVEQLENSLATWFDAAQATSAPLVAQIQPLQQFFLVMKQRAATEVLSTIPQSNGINAGAVWYKEGVRMLTITKQNLPDDMFKTDYDWAGLQNSLRNPAVVDTPLAVPAPDAPRRLVTVPTGTTSSQLLSLGGEPTNVVEDRSGSNGSESASNVSPRGNGGGYLVARGWAHGVANSTGHGVATQMPPRLGAVLSRAQKWFSLETQNRSSGGESWAELLKKSPFWSGYT